jgi:hypothetical protein
VGLPSLPFLILLTACARCDWARACVFVHSLTLVPLSLFPLVFSPFLSPFPFLLLFPFKLGLTPSAHFIRARALSPSFPSSHPFPLLSHDPSILVSLSSFLLALSVSILLFLTFLHILAQALLFFLSFCSSFEPLGAVSLSPSPSRFLFPRLYASFPAFSSPLSFYFP